MRALAAIAQLRSVCTVSEEQICNKGHHDVLIGLPPGAAIKLASWLIPF